MADFTPPTTKWEVNAQLEFDEALESSDPRWVDTSEARGEFSFHALYQSLGVDPDTRTLQVAPRKAYILFCGHRGAGKSTELRRAYRELNSDKAFFAVLLDATRQLDPNNLQYQDVLFGLAEALLDSIPETVHVDRVHIRKLEDFFAERVRTQTWSHELEASIETGVEADAGIPFIAKMFARVTAAFKTNSTHKDELRTVIRNHFGEFAEAFNQLILAVEDACAEAGLGRRVLFIVDGTDRLHGDDATRFFVEDVHQLQLVHSLFVYSTPIHLLHEGIDANHAFTDAFTLPMIKLYEREGQLNPAGFDAMRRLLLNRAPITLFDDVESVNQLVEHSGGHPRDLLRLLKYTFQRSRGDIFDRAAVEQALDDLAVDYRHILEPTDYALIAAVDEDPAGEHGTDRVRHLLFNLVILQYNSFWWKSHPVVRRLEGYRSAMAQQ